MMKKNSHPAKLILRCALHKTRTIGGSGHVCAAARLATLEQKPLEAHKGALCVHQQGRRDVAQRGLAILDLGEDPVGCKHGKST